MSRGNSCLTTLSQSPSLSLSLTNSFPFETLPIIQQTRHNTHDDDDDSGKGTLHSATRLIFCLLTRAKGKRKKKVTFIRADKTFTTAEVAQHKDDANGYWLIIENDVYDVSSMSSTLLIQFLPHHHV